MNEGSPNFLIVDMVLARELGRDAAWLIALLDFKATRWVNAQGWFHMSHRKMDTMISLSAHRQRNAAQRLMDAGIIETKVEGIMPNTTSYRIIAYTRPTGSVRNQEAPVAKNLTTVVKNSPTYKEGKKESCSGEQPDGRVAHPEGVSPANDLPNHTPCPDPKGGIPHDTLPTTDPNLPAGRNGVKPISKREKGALAKKTNGDLLNEVPEELHSVFNRWLEVGVKHTPGTRVFTDSIRAIKAMKAGSFFKDKTVDPNDVRPYTDDEICKALDRFDLKRNNSDFHGSKKFLKGLSLPQFFYNSFPSNPSKSIFLECLHSEPKRKDDHDLEFTTYVADMYNLSTGDRPLVEQVVGVAAKMDKFFKGHEEELRNHKIRTREKLVRLWIDWLATKFGKVNIPMLLSKKFDSQFIEYVED